MFSHKKILFFLYKIIFNKIFLLKKGFICEKYGFCIKFVQNVFRVEGFVL